MIDERYITFEKAEFYKARATKVIDNLRRRNMNGQFAANRQESLSLVMEVIQPGAEVARGVGITLDHIGLVASRERKL